MTLTRELLKQLPKAELHVHLDGCIRPQTMLDLAPQFGVSLPADDADALALAMCVRNAKNLEEYLERYEFTLAVMQSREAMERIAYEFAIDTAAENIRYVEVRYCPALHTPGLSLAEAIEAPIEGFTRARTETGIEIGIIICGLRTLPPSVSYDMAKAAVDYQSEGVVAFDLAGAELGHPAKDHVRAFDHALGNGLAITCHAGEGWGPESVWQAINDCRTQRIGHGTRVLEDAALEAYIIENRLPLEVCLTSNVHTNAVASVAEHPIRRYFDKDCVVTLSTDSRLMDNITLTDEYWAAHTELGFTREEIDQLIINSFESAFLPDDRKTALVADVRQELKRVQ